MKTNLYLRLALIATIAAHFASARENTGTGSGKKTTPPSINAACSEATVQTDLAVNNVRARILMGDMWWDLAHGAYEIPKGSGVMSMFAGSLWIGGVDNGGQLKVAAQTYRQTGNDFWPGPLDTSNASVSSDVCSEYDKHFRITRKEVENFVATGVSTPAIASWPGNGNQSLGQAQYLAPYFDANADGLYNPAHGDYPGYDLFAGDSYGDCQKGVYRDSCGSPTKVFNPCLPVDQLFGDETIWWVFNDKGNIHTETGGQPIGLEIRAQAFGFFTDDEINNMTFYNYRVINRSTYQVNSCYFGVWADADLGCAVDDYVGCDVKRGLGYTYNGDNDDDITCGDSKGYGINPPAVGIDFFRGPTADAGDGKDNDRNGQTDEACEQIIMSGFLYYDNISGPNGNPNGATHFYNYLKMTWGDGTPVRYGGNGYSSTGPVCQFMYPGNPTSDEHDWGIGGNITTTPTLAGWDEAGVPNIAADRRMLESAGPFTLQCGAVNVITTGVVWARATAGGAQASVKLLQIVDDKAQALFDNCFKVLDGPTAPDLTIQELDKELILYLTNTDPNSNNFNETYTEFDPLISLVDENGVPCANVNKHYNFEGYKIYQLKNATVSANDLEDPNLSRLVYQCDKKNGISRLINYEFDQALGAGVPKEKVNGADLGLAHSIKITTDAFASGNPNLINHKTYYFMAVAYGHNEYKKYMQDIPPVNTSMCDATVGATTGQKKPYKQGRKNLVNYSAIPHISTPYTGGTEIHGEYGSGPQIQRIEGNGNGGMNLEFTAATVSAILSSPDHRTKTPVYDFGRGPINVRVVDPLNVPEGHTFTLKFDSPDIANSNWEIANNTSGDVISSDKSIQTVNEQLLLTWGLSVSIAQIAEPGTPTSADHGFISANMTFADPSKRWLTGLTDKDGPYYANWIRSGTTINIDGFHNDYIGIDNDQIYEGVISGTWAPYRVCAGTELSAAFDPAKYYTGPSMRANSMNNTKMSELASVDVVLTADKSKWSRCVVLEMCEDPAYSLNTSGEPNNARKLDYRRAPSVDKNGSTASGPDNNDFATGMGWFPGYAINLETGERLNIAFGENSALVNENGSDMKWNPTSNQTATTYNLPWDLAGQVGSPVYGGQHYIYVFGHNKDNDTSGSPTPNDFVNIPRYDAGKTQREILGMNNGVPSETPSGKEKVEMFNDAMWVNIPLLTSGYSFADAGNIPTDVTVRLRVGKAYKAGYSAASIRDGLVTINTDTASVAFGENKNLPMYRFTTEGIATHTSVSEAAVEALDIIRAVPNPYYAYSNYETSSLDNRVKITNLPEVCTVSIFNLSGTLIRKYKKGEQMVSLTPKGPGSPDSWHDGTLDWDLKNSAGMPISSGVYIIHVDVPGVGEKVVKWFGVMRPIDLDSF